MLQSDVPLQIVSPAYRSAPFKRTDAILARYIVLKSVAIVCCPEVAVNRLLRRLLLAANWALVG